MNSSEAPRSVCLFSFISRHKGVATRRMFEASLDPIASRISTQDVEVVGRFENARDGSAGAVDRSVSNPVSPPTPNQCLTTCSRGAGGVGAGVEDCDTLQHESSRAGYVKQLIEGH